MVKIYLIEYVDVNDECKIITARKFAIATFEFVEQTQCKSKE